jgi:hypothetical protein
LPWAHGHQRKAIRDFVQAIIDRQTGCQAQLARCFGNQAAATKRLSRLLHNARLEPRHLADAGLLQALVQRPSHGPVRLAIDWTSEGLQHLSVVLLIIGRRAGPLYWRAYDAAVLQGRMKRYELAVLRRAVTRIIRKVGRRRVRVTADRDFADVALFTLLTDLGVAFVMRGKKSTKICRAANLYPDVQSAAEAMVRVRSRIELNPDIHEVYQFYVDQYINTYPPLQELTHAMTRYVETRQQ